MFVVGHVSCPGPAFVTVVMVITGVLKHWVINTGWWQQSMEYQAGVVTEGELHRIYNAKFLIAGFLWIIISQGVFRELNGRIIRVIMYISFPANNRSKESLLFYKFTGIKIFRKITRGLSWHSDLKEDQLFTFHWTHLLLGSRFKWLPYKYSLFSPNHESIQQEWLRD